MLNIVSERQEEYIVISIISKTEYEALQYNVTKKLLLDQWLKLPC